MKNKQDKAKLQAARADVESLVKKHGFHAVRWVINKLTEKERLRRELAKEKSRLNERIREIESKLEK